MTPFRWAALFFVVWLFFGLVGVAAVLLSLAYLNWRKR